MLITHHFHSAAEASPWYTEAPREPNPRYSGRKARRRRRPPGGKQRKTELPGEDLAPGAGFCQPLAARHREAPRRPEARAAAPGELRAGRPSRAPRSPGPGPPPPPRLTAGDLPAPAGKAAGSSGRRGRGPARRRLAALPPRRRPPPSDARPDGASASPGRALAPPRRSAPRPGPGPSGLSSQPPTYILLHLGHLVLR